MCVCKQWPGICYFGALSQVRVRSPSKYRFTGHYWMALVTIRDLELPEGLFSRDMSDESDVYSVADSDSESDVYAPPAKVSFFPGRFRLAAIRAPLAPIAIVLLNILQFPLFPIPNRPQLNPQRSLNLRQFLLRLLGSQSRLWANQQPQTSRPPPSPKCP